jgi:hypothetical protein
MKGGKKTQLIIGGTIMSLLAIGSLLGSQQKAQGKATIDDNGEAQIQASIVDIQLEGRKCKLSLVTRDPRGDMEERSLSAQRRVCNGLLLDVTPEGGRVFKGYTVSLQGGLLTEIKKSQLPSGRVYCGVLSKKGTFIANERGVGRAQLPSEIQQPIPVGGKAVFKAFISPTDTGEEKTITSIDLLDGDTSKLCPRPWLNP